MTRFIKKQHTNESTYVRSYQIKTCIIRVTKKINQDQMYWVQEETPGVPSSLSIGIGDERRREREGGG